MDQEMLEVVKRNFLKKEEGLSSYATLSNEAIRMTEEQDDKEIRPPFFHDIDRIIHAWSYTRYMNKTQVFSFRQNDHLSKRIIHVQLVSKIARTIARALALNEDLTEAIALGHDIGHTPIGHVGESILNDISKRELGEIFQHNIQSVRTYIELENHGNGLNLTVQVLDGILCHNGEIEEPCYVPVPKTKEEFWQEYQKCYKNTEIARKVRPMTMEGCVVRISDMIAYLGRDIEDAINIRVIRRQDVPEEIRQVLGSTNREIVNTLIRDIICNSIGKPYIQMSDRVYKALKELKKFNYEHIYHKANTEETIAYYRNCFETLFQVYYQDLEQHNTKSEIFRNFLNQKNEYYHKNTSDKRKVIDFLAGMTDDYFLQCYKKRVVESVS